MTLRPAVVALMLIVTLLAACTRVDLAYRNLDVIIPWTLNDYLDMNREQKSWFNDRLKEHLRWHCSTQLPGYLPWLDRLQRMAGQPQVDDGQLQALTEDGKAAVAQVTREITPSAVELLRGLDDAQVRAMAQAFAEDIADRRKEYVQPPLARQISDRSERMEKRLKPWLGSVNEAQREHIEQWSQALGAQNQAWIDNREHWQNQLLAAMAERQSAEFPARIARLLQDRESFWTPAYRNAFQHTEEAARTLIEQVMAQSTPAQRQTLQGKIGELRADFTKLVCAG